MYVAIISTSETQLIQMQEGNTGNLHHENFRLRTMSDTVIISAWETREPGGLPSYIGWANPPDERKEGLPMVTYSDLIQFCIFIVSLVGLCHKIFKDKRK